MVGIRILDSPLGVDYVNVVRVVEHKVINIHMSEEATDNNVSILLHPKRILLPASFIPAHLALCPSRWYMARHDGFHAASAQELQLNA